MLEQGCEADFTLSQEKAVKYVSGLQSIDELKQALCDNVTESIDAPRFLIIDGPPVFHPDELNCIALALVERQQAFLNNYIKDKLKAAFPSKYQEEQPEPQPKADSRARSKSSQKSART